MTSLVVTKENFKQIREEGIGNGFSVINPHDGFRKDNRLWFGNCSECGELVTNSSLTGKGWEHTVYTVKTANHSSSYQVGYCPSKN